MQPKQSDFLIILVYCDKGGDQWNLGSKYDVISR